MRVRRRLALGLLLLGLVVFFNLPHHYPEAEPGLTSTAAGAPGDPVNVGLVSSATELVEALQAAGWVPADARTWRSSLRITHAVAFNHSYETAPVSDLFLFGRAQDLAFERQEGKSPRRRHHVRFWRSPEEVCGRPLWLGAATYDSGVGLNRRTYGPTHRVDPEVDRERDRLFADLDRAGRLLGEDREESAVPRLGVNGGGDPFISDGARRLGVLAVAADAR